MKNSVIKPFGQFLRAQTIPTHALRTPRGQFRHRRAFHPSAALGVVKPYLLADIGEGITECQIIQWFVEPGATVEQFDKICEVQSDKATVEITSRFDGVIKKRYYEADDMAKVGKPLVDIDINPEEVSAADKDLIKEPQEPTNNSPSESHTPQTAKQEPKGQEPSKTQANTSSPKSSGRHASLATPAVRHMIKEHKLDITSIQGTGKDGRVLKEDVQRHNAAAQENIAPQPSNAVQSALQPSPSLAEDKVLPLTGMQSQMFKTMTRSLSIPHFLYTDSIDFSSITTLRRKLNAAALTSTSASPIPKLSSLPFIVKAVSLALTSYPTLNAHLDTSGPKPLLTHRAAHNIGIAVDSPAGLIVPVIHNVQSHTIHSLAAEIAHLGALARSGKLTTADLSGATFTVSNIGSIGGGAVAPVIVPPQVGILGVGRARVVPAFGADGEVARREECVFSWSADHRVVDGAMAARCADEVRGYLEDVESMLVKMR